MFSWHISGLATQSHWPPTPLSAQRFHLPPSSQLHSSWHYLLFYCAELTWRSSKSHKCTVLEGEKVWTRSRPFKLTWIKQLHLQVHKREILAPVFWALSYAILHIWIKPKSRSCPFSSSGSEMAYMACLFYLRWQKCHETSWLHKLPVIFPLEYFKNNLGNFGASHWSYFMTCLQILILNTQIKNGLSKLSSFFFFFLSFSFFN